MSSKKVKDEEPTKVQITAGTKVTGELREMKGYFCSNVQVDWHLSVTLNCH